MLVAERPLVMGIMNITADSFYKGFLAESIPFMLESARQMIFDGAHIIDVGGQTTKPGSKGISPDEELERVVPVIAALHRAFPDLIISIDTYYSRVAKETIAAGASIINDISGGNIDPDMIPTAGALKVPYVCMHMQGTPDSMQKDPSYTDVVKEVLEFFIQKTAQCIAAGIHDVILDPGIGFGKTMLHNFTLLKNLHKFRMIGKPILAGISRKGTIYRTLNITADEALNGTTVLNTIALQNGADILRVHDVKEAKEAITLFEAYKNA